MKITKKAFRVTRKPFSPRQTILKIHQSHKTYEKNQITEAIFLQTRLATSEEIRDWCVRGKFTEEVWDLGIHPDELFPKVETKRKSKKRKKKPKSKLIEKPLLERQNYKFLTKGSGITAETLKYKTYQPESKGLFCEYFFGPVEGGRCPHCGWYGPITPTAHLSCPNPDCSYPELETRITRRSQIGYIRLAIPCIHPWYAFSWSSPLSTFLGIEPSLLQFIFDFEAFIVNGLPLYDYCIVPPDFLLLPRFSRRHLMSIKWIKKSYQKNKLRDPIGWRGLIWESNQWNFIHQLWRGKKNETKISTSFHPQKSDLKVQTSDLWEYLLPTIPQKISLRFEIINQTRQKSNLVKPNQYTKSGKLEAEIQTELQNIDQQELLDVGSGGYAISSLLDGLPRSANYSYPAFFEQWISKPTSSTIRFNGKNQNQKLAFGRSKPIPFHFSKGELQNQRLVHKRFTALQNDIDVSPKATTILSTWQLQFTIRDKLKQIHRQTLLSQGGQQIRVQLGGTFHYRALWRSLLQWNLTQDHLLIHNSLVNLGLTRTIGGAPVLNRLNTNTQLTTNIEVLYRHLIPVPIRKLNLRKLSHRSRLNPNAKIKTIKKSHRGLNVWGQIPFGRILAWKLWFHYTDSVSPFSSLPFHYPCNSKDTEKEKDTALRKRKSWQLHQSIELTSNSVFKWADKNTRPTIVESFGKSTNLSKRPILTLNNLLLKSKVNTITPLLLNKSFRQGRLKTGGWSTFYQTLHHQFQTIELPNSSTNRIAFSNQIVRSGYRFTDKVEKAIVVKHKAEDTETRKWPKRGSKHQRENIKWSDEEIAFIKETHTDLLDPTLSSQPTFEEIMVDEWLLPRDATTPLLRIALRLFITKATRSWIRRYRLLEHLQRGLMEPDALILKRLPLLPPTLRPILRLRVGQGRLATSDINFLYRTVILRNISIQEHVARKLEFGNPELKSSPLIVQRSDKNFLTSHESDNWMIGQGAARPTGVVLGNYMIAHFRRSLLGVIENSKLGKTAFRQSNWRPTSPTADKTQSTQANTPLVSLADTLKGKYGLLRRHMLGKRADYSGRTVIVAGPELALEECGIPYDIALGLFRPFLIHIILRDRRAGSIGGAKRLLQSCQAMTYRLLEAIVEHHPLLLNRAPTLHRMGIQSFTPVLVPGFAVQLHPLVCPPFNADFDGDTIAIHLPMSHLARAEAHVLLSGSLFPVSPASGDGSLLPSQDIVLGCFALTQSQGDDPLEGLGSGQIYSEPQSLIHGLEQGSLATCTYGWIKWNYPPQGDVYKAFPNELRIQQGGTIQTIYSNYIIIFYSNGRLAVAMTKTTPGHSLVQRALTSALM